MTLGADQPGAASRGGMENDALMNVGNIERTVSILAGAVGLLLLSRRLFVYVTLALISAYAISRGVTGRCALYTRANINTRGQDGLLAGTPDSVRSAGANAVDRIGNYASEQIESEQVEIDKWMERERAQDQVEQSSWESFPASDPPGGSIA